MMTLRGAMTQLLMPRYARGDLPAPLARWVRAGIEQDVELTEAYTQLRHAERVAARAAISAAQRELLERAVFADLDAVEPASSSLRQRKPSLSLSHAVPFLASAASIALFVLVAERSPTYGAADLAARGADLARAPLGVKVSCVHGTSVVDTATVGVRRPSDELTCKDDALLAYALTNLSEEVRFVFIVGVSARGEPRWYAPFEKRSEALRLEAGLSNDVLPILGDTRGMTDDDRVSLYVLLSDQPFSASDIERQLNAARARGVHLAGVERLPLPDVPVQARVDMARR